MIDQFTFADRLKEALRKQGVNLPVEIRPRAEDNPAVAAASRPRAAGSARSRSFAR